MPSNSELFETYGYKAHEKGWFNEWQHKTSSILEKNPKLDPSDAAAEAYYTLKEELKNDGSR
jgi:hypothetical protein